MFDSGDVVEEIATGRKGVMGLSTVGPKFEVRFFDGKQPLVKGYDDSGKLHLIQRPGETGTPRLIPKNSVV
jgi:hypothetical protein